VPSSLQSNSTMHGLSALHHEQHFRTQQSHSVAERTSLAVTLFGALSSHANSNVWHGLWRHAMKGAPSSPQFNSTMHGLSASHCELMFQNVNEPLGGCDELSHAF
jgi:hypothetical protein